MAGKKALRKRCKEVLKESRKEGRNLEGRHGWKEGTEEEMEGKC